MKVETLTDPRDEVVFRVRIEGGKDLVTQEVSKKMSLEMESDDEAKRNGNNGEMEGIVEDEELRQIEAQLLSATPIFDLEGLTALHRVAEIGLGRRAATVARLLTACPALIDAVSQVGEEKKQDIAPVNNPAAGYAGRTALHGAARNGHAAIVAQLLAVKPASIEARTSEGLTVLNCAARGGHAEIVTQLLALNPGLIDARANDGCTALHSAASGGNAVIVRQLLAVNPALSEAKDNRGWTALHWAAYEGHAAIVTQLLAANPGLVDARANNGETAFHCAARGGHAAIMTHLKGVSPTSIEARLLNMQLEDEENWRNDMKQIDEELRKKIETQLLSAVPISDGRAALYRAAESGLRGVVARLLAACPALLDTVEWENWHGTPLHSAASYGHAAIVAQLLAVNPALAESMYGGSTALHDAAKKGHTAIVTQLMDVNPGLAEARDSNNKCTALHDAARKGHPAIVAQLLAVKPALIDARTNDGETALHFAACGGHAAIVSLLLAAKPALIDARTEKDETVLHCAAASGDVAIVTKVLAANPALIDVRDGGLQLAVYSDHAAIVEHLLAVNPSLALIDSRDDVGDTLLHHAASYGSAAVVARLLAANPALAEARAENGCTALHYAAQRGEEATVAQLLAVNPALVDVRENSAETALHWAAGNGKAATVTQLLAAKASIDARAEDGRTALHCAVIAQHYGTIEELLAAKPASIEARTKKGHTVLHCAVGDDDITAQLLAAHPALLDAIIQDADGWTALLNVVEMNHEEALSRLLAMHPDLIHQTSADRGWTVFHFAALRGRDTMMSGLLASVSQPEQLEQLLLRRSTEWLDDVNPSLTALHVAAMKGHCNIVTQLLAVCPALIDVLDEDNQTCLHWAARGFHDSTLERLLAFKPALAHAVDAYGNNMLHFMLVRHWPKTALVAREACLQRVWKMNPAALHAGNGRGRTPFDFAVADSNVIAIDLLQWKLTFDEVVSAYEKCGLSYVARFKPLMELQCEGLSAVLISDVVGMVFEYLGFGVEV